MKKQTLFNYSIFLFAIMGALLLHNCNKEKSDDDIEENEWWVLKVGDNFAGGTIIYLNPQADRGIIVAPSDQNGTFRWGCPEKFINTNRSFGTGLTNTQKILTNCNEPNIAAKTCYDLHIPSSEDNMMGDFSKWYLPSLDELKYLYQSKNIVGGFDNVPYWTSTDFSIDGAYAVSFLDGMVLEGGKSFTTPRVRCFRSFYLPIK